MAVFCCPFPLSLSLSWLTWGSRRFPRSTTGECYRSQLIIVITKNSERILIATSIARLPVSPFFPPRPSFSRRVCELPNYCPRTSSKDTLPRGEPRRSAASRRVADFRKENQKWEIIRIMTNNWKSRLAASASTKSRRSRLCLARGKQSAFSIRF